jgi:hypothetical protein
MTSSDMVAIAAHGRFDTEEDKYVLVWGNSEVLENFYAVDVPTARKMQEEYDGRTGLRTKLYMKVKE